MKAEIKNFHSPDVDLENYVPENKDCFCFLLQVIIGAKEGDGEESFDILVCTPKWLYEHYPESALIFGEHFLFVFNYDLHAIKEKISNYVDSIEADDWTTIGNKLDRIGKWEFRDYDER